MSQHICKFIDNARMKIHAGAERPPAMMKAPLKAHSVDEYMSFGVMSLKHCAGDAARGIVKPIAIHMIATTRHTPGRILACSCQQRGGGGGI